MNAQLAAIAYYLPERVETNADLAAKYPAWNLGQVHERSGVASRHIAGPDETAFDLSLKACEKLFAAPAFDGGAVSRDVDGIIFCTQSPDFIMPSNAHLLHAALELPDEVLAFDFNLACSGYVYGLALAQSLIGAGLASAILLVTADTYSKYINPGDRSARVLFGDGAAATLLTAANAPAFAGFELWSRGKAYDKFYIPCGGLRRPKSPATAVASADRNGNLRSPDDIYMDGLAVWSFINSAVPKQIEALLAKNGRSLADIDKFAFHQASKLTLDSLVKILDVPPAKVLGNLAAIGNTVSSSIPILIKDAIDAGNLRRGERVLLSGFGVGLSYASAIWEFN